MGAPLAQAAAHTNHIVSVYADRVEIRSGWQGDNVEVIDLRDISTVETRGLVNCTLTLTSNKGRVYELKRMALPEAREIKATIQTQKQRAGTYE